MEQVAIHVEVPPPENLLAVSLAEARQHLRVTHLDEDEYIKGLVRVGTECVEGRTRRQLLAATIRHERPWFRDEIRLPRPPLIELLSFRYLDEDGEEQDVPEELYGIQPKDTGAVLFRQPEAEWPVTARVPDAVRIRYRAGYVDLVGGEPVGRIPWQARAAILMIAGHLYAHREDVGVATNAVRVPQNSAWLMEKLEVPLV